MQIGGIASVGLFRGRTFARLALLAASVKSLHNGAVRRVNDLVKTVKEWKEATVLKTASTPHPSSLARGDANGGMSARGEKVRFGAATLARWCDAANGDQTSGGRRLLG